MLQSKMKMEKIKKVKLLLAYIKFCIIVIVNNIKCLCLLTNLTIHTV